MTDQVNQSSSRCVEKKAAASDVEAIVDCMQLCSGNTIPFCVCLSVCSVAMPYRDAEKTIQDDPAVARSSQSAHTLVELLIETGAIQRIEVGVPTLLGDASQEDQPVDYLLSTTDAGREALSHFDPLGRFSELISNEPANYSHAYAKVLARCATSAKLSDIDEALAGEAALHSPKTIYPQYFISKLESIGGLVWADSWKTTDAGMKMLAAIE